METAATLAARIRTVVGWGVGEAGIGATAQPKGPSDKEAAAKYREWETASRAFIRKVRLGSGGNDPHYLPKPSDPEGVELLKAIGGDAKLKALYEALLKEQEEFAWRDLYGNNGTMYDKSKEPFWMPRYRPAQEKYDLWFTTGNNWIAWTTYSFATPVTDGRYVYVTTANNAVAAVDYDGKIAWLVWEHVPKGNVGVLHTRFVASPVLYKGKLVVNQNGHIRCYDAATGKKLWGYYNPYKALMQRTVPQFPWRPTPEASSPNVTTLKLPEGGHLDVVLDGEHLIFRLEDGQLLGTDLPTHQKGSTSITVGDTYLYVTDGDRQAEFCGGGLRLKAVSRDQVEVEWLWKSPDRLCGSTTPVFWNGRFFAHSAFSHDYRTGQKQLLFNDKRFFGGTGPILAGRQLVALYDHGKAAVGDLESKAITRIDNAYLDQRHDEDSEFGLVNWKIPSGYQQNSAPSAQANRIFYRSRGILWCIGDKTQLFPLPKNCPLHGRVR